ncbi:helix-turn-helix domain-containing protein [Pontiella sulfatireligans]|uniref:Antitoxin HigA n=1 Tax=Pontiella sulfatireligans TaxID=2750658 RepID=A0A6C2UNI1_9BACT|nr:helix-turn-helix domain-containing protein [Pontiella sulfatireligans]VGO20897.1 Antitoxin HigA [Pontiella sulfatireligans]
MKAKIIKTEEEYEAMLKRVEVLMDAEPATPEEEELELLGLLVESYEKEHYPIGLPTPIEAIEFAMDQKKLTQADMVQYLGSPSKVSEVLRGKRALSKTMIRKLVEGLGISPEILLEVEQYSKVSYLNPKPARLRVAEDGASYGKKTKIPKP